MIRDKLIKMLHKKVYEVTLVSCEQVEVEPGLGMFNLSCFNNCVQQAVTRDYLDVVECIYFDDGWPILHYINYNNFRDCYEDNTLGYAAKKYKYFITNKIDRDDWYSLPDIYWDNKAKLNKLFIKWYHKLFCIFTVV